MSTGGRAGGRRLWRREWLQGRRQGPRRLARQRPQRAPDSPCKTAPLLRPTLEITPPSPAPRQVPADPQRRRAHVQVCWQGARPLATGHSPAEARPRSQLHPPPSRPHNPSLPATVSYAARTFEGVALNSHLASDNYFYLNCVTVGAGAPRAPLPPPARAASPPLPPSPATLESRPPPHTHTPHLRARRASSRAPAAPST